MTLELGQIPFLCITVNSESNSIVTTAIFSTPWKIEPSSLDDKPSSLDDKSESAVAISSPDDESFLYDLNSTLRPASIA